MDDFVEEEPGLPTTFIRSDSKHGDSDGDESANASVIEDEEYEHNNNEDRMATEALLMVGQKPRDVTEKALEVLNSPVSPVHTHADHQDAKEIEDEESIQEEDEEDQGNEKSKQQHGDDQKALPKRRVLRKGDFKPNKQRHFNAHSKHEWNASESRENRENAMRLTREHLKNDAADSKIQQWLSKKAASQNARWSRLQQNQIKMPVIGSLSIENDEDGNDDDDRHYAAVEQPIHRQSPIHMHAQPSTSVADSGAGVSPRRQHPHASNPSSSSSPPPRLALVPNAIILSRKAQQAEALKEKKLKRMLQQQEEQARQRQQQQQVRVSGKPSPQQQHARLHVDNGDDASEEEGSESLQVGSIREMYKSKPVKNTASPEPYIPPLNVKKSSPVRTSLSKEETSILLGGPFRRDTNASHALNVCWKLRIKLYKMLQSSVLKTGALLDTTHRMKIYKYLLAMRLLSLEVAENVWRCRNENLEVDELWPLVGSEQLHVMSRDMAYLDEVPQFNRFFDVIARQSPFLIPMNVRETTMNIRQQHLELTDLLETAQKEREHALPVMAMNEMGVIRFPQPMLQRLARSHGLTVKPAKHLFENPSSADILRVMAFEAMIAEEPLFESTDTSTTPYGYTPENNYKVRRTIFKAVSM